VRRTALAFGLGLGAGFLAGWYAGWRSLAVIATDMADRARAERDQRRYGPWTDRDPEGHWQRVEHK